MLAAIPMQNVCTGAVMYCIVSYIARPAETDPPGELMYSLIGLRESSASRKRSWAVRSVEVWSWTCCQGCAYGCVWYVGGAICGRCGG
jgi:hypothetical protein